MAKAEGFSLSTGDNTPKESQPFESAFIARHSHLDTACAKRILFLDPPRIKTGEKEKMKATKQELEYLERELRRREDKYFELRSAYLKAISTESQSVIEQIAFDEHIAFEFWRLAQRTLAEFRGENAQLDRRG